MAATNGILEGGVVTIYVGSTAVAYSDNATLQISAALREIKNKTDGRWTKRKQGRLDASGSCHVLYALLSDTGTSIYNLQDVMTDILNGTEVTLKYTNANAGDYEWTGKAQFSGVNVTFGDYGENAEGDFSWQASDAWALTVIT